MYNLTGKFTSESVSEGHPDKICDRISDAILDDALEKDPKSKVAIETMANKGFIVVGGEMSTSTYVDIDGIVRRVLEKIGYHDEKYGISSESCGVLVSINEQSPDISQGVDKDELGAGDQGLMFGYADRQTPQLMPLPIMMAHLLMKRYSEKRKNGEIRWARPDAKAQVTIDYENGVPKRIDTVVISAQHDEDVTDKIIYYDLKKLTEEVAEGLGYRIDEDTNLLFNPSGRFVIGGPQADVGLTGRKIIVDTYGGWSPHGGGCFSGKDPSKVDRSATYAARWIAKNVVGAGIATKCLIQLSYAIGIANPVSVYVETFNTSTYTNDEIAKAIRSVFDLTPNGIIRDLDLLKPVYEPTTSYGHFGDSKYSWERLDRAHELKEEIKKVYLENRRS